MATRAAVVEPVGLKAYWFAKLRPGVGMLVVEAGGIATRRLRVRFPAATANTGMGNRRSKMVVSGKTSDRLSAAKYRWDDEGRCEENNNSETDKRRVRRGQCAFLGLVFSVACTVFVVVWDSDWAVRVILSSVFSVALSTSVGEWDGAFKQQHVSTRMLNDICVYSTFNRNVCTSYTLLHPAVVVN